MDVHHLQKSQFQEVLKLLDIGIFWCKALTIVTIPESVTVIKNNVLEGRSAP